MLPITNMELNDIGASQSPVNGSSSGYRLVPGTAAANQPPQPKSKSVDWTSRLSRRASWGAFWVFEIAAILLSLVFMIAVIIVLKQVDGQPMSTWNMPLSPNTLIAVFSTLSKSAMLLVISECLSQLKWVYFEQRGHRLIDLQIFDDASRGPLGAVSFLLRVRWRAAAASCGALLTILALAQDAFYQEIYSTYTNATAQTADVASIAWSRSLDTRTMNSGSGRSISLNEHMLKLIHEAKSRLPTEDSPQQC